MNGLKAVIDLSHHNHVATFDEICKSGVLAVLHKATQGFRSVDPTYEPRRQPALNAGLLWGTYHFGVGGDGTLQAQHFLDTVQASARPSDLLVLDFEPNTSGSSMSLDDAELFAHFVHEQTGKWPGLYSGSYIKSLLGNSKDTILANCWFWLAQYGPLAKVPPAWADWTLWQYSDGIEGPGPHPVPGVGHCDLDAFNGDETALREFWATGAPQIGSTR